ncbi:Uncharacterised protein [Candidatus Tiddalikarchaeum anstoanum]|nr:Uncharacterised protein [Candidatus Tiddalikarchaeum anstoanum]
MTYPDGWKCPNCGSTVKNNRQCPHCNFSLSSHFPSLWHCPNCKTLVSDSESCTECGYPSNINYPELWKCPQCNELVHNSPKCNKCGYDNKPGLVKVHPESIEKKVSHLDLNLDLRKQVLLGAVILIVFIGLALILSIPAEPVNNFSTKNVTSGVAFSPFFSTSSSAQRVLFDFISPKGTAYTLDGVQDGNKWVINDLVLNESGLWRVVIKVENFGAVSEVTNFVYANASCSVNEECSNGRICCFGTCISPVCRLNGDCSDGIDATIDSCVLANTCESSCKFTEPSCNSLRSDNYCPLGCNRLTDVDCSDCPTGQLLCDGNCQQTCNSNSECDDGSNTTFDECVMGLSPCDSHCVNTPYSEFSCPSGKVRFGDSCIRPVCNTDSDCVEGGSNYAGHCWNSGTPSSYCAYEQCLPNQTVCVVNGREACINPVCDSNTDCDKGSPNAFYYCMNHGACDAYCTTTCLSGFSSTQGQCMKSCTSVSDCALYNASFSTSCLTECVSNETCMVNCYKNQGLTYYCDYASNLCKKYECVAESNCNDNNYCTRDYCSTDFACHNDFLSSGTLVNGNNGICCGSYRDNCANNSMCNVPAKSLTFSSSLTGLTNTVNPASNMLLTGGYARVTANTFGSGVYAYTPCVDGKPFFITAKIKVESGSVLFSYEAASANSNLAKIFALGNEWQTYAINGTVNCNTPGSKNIIFYANSSNVIFDVDDINIFIGQGNPRNCANPNTCTSGCNTINSCINSDGFCPTGCTNETDNDCKICSYPDIYDGAKCATVICSDLMPCPNWWSVCANPGTSSSNCAYERVAAASFDCEQFNNGLASGFSINNLNSNEYSINSIYSNHVQNVSTSTAGAGVYANVASLCNTGNKYVLRFDLYVSSGVVVAGYEPDNSNSRDFGPGTYLAVTISGTSTSCSYQNIKFYAKNSVLTSFAVDNVKLWIDTAQTHYTPTCGNGACDSGETYAACTSDCFTGTVGCDSVYYEGDCCVDSNCTTGLTCTNHACK